MGWHLHPGTGTRQCGGLGQNQSHARLKSVSRSQTCPQQPSGLCSVSLGHSLAKGPQPWDGDRDGDRVTPQQPLPAGTEQ